MSHADHQIRRKGRTVPECPGSVRRALAVALGLEGLEDFGRERVRLRQAVADELPLTRLDWARALLATEIVFAGDMVGNVHDWSFTVGIDDDETLTVLRGIQLKVTGEVRPQDST